MHIHLYYLQKAKCWVSFLSFTANTQRITHLINTIYFMATSIWHSCIIWSTFTEWIRWKLSKTWSCLQRAWVQSNGRGHIGCRSSNYLPNHGTKKAQRWASPIRRSLIWVLNAERESGRQTKGHGGRGEEKDIQAACSNAGSCEGEWHVPEATLMEVQSCEENRTYTNKWQNTFLRISITINQPNSTNKDTYPNNYREFEPCSKIL